MAEIDPTAFQIYKQAAQQRRQVLQSQASARQEQAWTVARKAAQILRDEFQVTKVVAFGSLIHAGQFHQRSDVDLAVWGMVERDYFRAVGRLQSIDPTIGVDLIMFDDAKPTLQTVIQQDGVAL